MTDEIQQENPEVTPEHELPTESEVPKDEGEITPEAPPPEEKEDALSEEKEELELPEGTDEDEEKKTWPKGVAERIKREKAKTARIQAEAARAQAELERLRAMPITPSQNYASVTETAPSRDQFQNDSDYFDAMLDHKARRLQAENQARAYTEAQNEFKKRFVSVNEKGEEKYQDYEEVTSVLHQQDFPSNRAMAEAIVDSEYGRDMFYFLGKYPDEAKRIANLNPVAAVKEIARLEVRFKERQRSKVTKTPPALSVIKGGGGGNAANRNPEKIESVSDYTKWYNEKYGRR